MLLVLDSNIFDKIDVDKLTRDLLADTEGAVLVSEDKRLIRRALKQGVEALQYKEFACRLRDMD